MNNIYEDIKYKFNSICHDKKISCCDALLYMIFSEYPIDVIDYESGNIERIKEGLKREYNILWDMQPSLEENEDKAFAIQHARDIYDVLLGREGGYEYDDRSEMPWDYTNHFDSGEEDE